MYLARTRLQLMRQACKIKIKLTNKKIQHMLDFFILANTKTYFTFCHQKVAKSAGAAKLARYI